MFVHYDDAVFLLQHIVAMKGTYQFRWTSIVENDTGPHIFFSQKWFPVRTLTSISWCGDRT